jgi:two-component system sensor histidine kinase PilS (NtrC family)
MLERVASTQAVLVAPQRNGRNGRRAAAENGHSQAVPLPASISARRVNIPPEGTTEIDDDARTLGRLITRETDRLSRLLSEFLDFARVRVTRTAPVDVAALARGAASLAAAHPDAREGLRLDCVIPEGPVVISGDDDLLHRAVFNLVLNAVQAAPAHGSVRIEVMRLNHDQLPTGVWAEPFEEGAVCVRVSDDGPGIAAEIRDRLFEPFTTTKPGGSGLGLSIVHRAIEAHRGLVLVDSGAETPGTRVTVLLPVSGQSDGSTVPVTVTPGGSVAIS